MQIKKYQNPDNGIIRQPTRWELDRAKEGSAVFVTDDGQRLNYVPQGYSVVDGSDRQTTMKKDGSDYHRGYVLDEVTVTAPKLTDQDREKLQLLRQGIQNQGEISPLSESEWEDRRGFWNNIRDRMNITGAQFNPDANFFAKAVDRNLNELSQGRHVLNGLWNTFGQAGMAASVQYTKPIQWISGIGLGSAWNNAPKIFSDKTLGDWIGELPFLTSDMGNTAVYLGTGASGPYKARVAFYNNKNPYGYGNKLQIEGQDVKELRSLPNEVIRGVGEWILNPFSWKPKETPYWKAVLQSDKYKKQEVVSGLPIGANAEFRDMILRQVLKLPENKNGTIFVKKPNGTYGVDMTKRNNIVKQYGGSDYDGTVLELVGSRNYKYGNVTDYDFTTPDSIIGVGGIAKGTFKVNPNTGKTTATISDLWDIQPFSDWRSPIPWLNPIAKNFEAMGFLGGKPTTQVITIDNPTMRLVKGPDLSKHIISKYY